ncbi:hypothetical protein ES703_91499 [subsurface metagenome]
MKRLTLLSVSLCICISLAGQQTLDIFTISGRYGFPQSYDSILTNKAKEYGCMVSLVAPVKFSEKTIWVNSINYFYWHVSNDEELPPEIANPIGLHGFLFSDRFISEIF